MMVTANILASGRKEAGGRGGGGGGRGEGGRVTRSLLLRLSPCPLEFLRSSGRMRSAAGPDARPKRDASLKQGDLKRGDLKGANGRNAAKKTSSDGRDFFLF